MSDAGVEGPESTAVRVALWRALHLEVDPAPPVFEDRVGLALVAPGPEWRERPDMEPEVTRRVRASIVARARFIEDLLAEQAGGAVAQYAILGAGLDSFVQRRPEVAARFRTYEVDQPGPQAWKRRRLAELGYGVPEHLRLVPVDFEAGASWWDRIAAAGFDARRPALVSSLGVSMYLTREAVLATLRQVAGLAPGSILALSFLLPLDLVEAEEQPMRQATEAMAQAAGTPFVSFFAPDEIMGLAREAGFGDVRHVSADDLARRYFAGSGGLRPSSSEQLMVAVV
ncbi:class I SAM-dependent methyltransferase [Phenylobacterium sp.]|uniref:class I SAM-dependent methyltransferase n=1 Tax=Phenylobacterium sp. TaxID=1871053 RepID=UPI0025D51B90|nr:class I SAM-dependent methyltransferase [Phenylobacterium sp.]MBX3485931.1 class I SAM-dependent methyltransferase [Phenylobacterium sp.]MCW5761562.1 class I SAM-dependent methyltransferase [Phenylobacterium sp.]